MRVGGRRAPMARERQTASQPGSTTASCSVYRSPERSGRYRQASPDAVSRSPRSLSPLGRTPHRRGQGGYGTGDALRANTNEHAQSMRALSHRFVTLSCERRGEEGSESSRRARVEPRRNVLFSSSLQELPPSAGRDRRTRPGRWRGPSSRLLCPLALHPQFIGPPAEEKLRRTFSTIHTTAPHPEYASRSTALSSVCDTVSKRSSGSRSGSHSDSAMPKSFSDAVPETTKSCSAGGVRVKGGDRGRWDMRTRREEAGRVSV